MSEIVERRWRCNYCGNVSPVLEQKVDPGVWRNLVQVPPNGWIEFPRITMDVLHFCCGLHEVYYHNKHTESAETPEEVKA